MGRFATLLLILVCTAAAGDDFKVMKLEQDVRNLERQVQELSRQLTDLQRAANAAGQRLPAPESAVLPATPVSWLDADNWKRVRNGMDEFEVISLLGPPTSLRGASDSSTRTLMYAMEIGSSGFLSGSVQLKDRRVVGIQMPGLR